MNLKLGGENGEQGNAQIALIGQQQLTRRKQEQRLAARNSGYDARAARYSGAPAPWRFDCDAVAIGGLRSETARSAPVVIRRARSRAAVDVLLEIRQPGDEIEPIERR